MDLEKNLSAHGYTPGEVEAGDYCFDDTTVLLGEYIIESRRLRARVAELEAQCSRVGDINVCLYAELEKLEARVAELEGQVTEIPTLFRRYEARVAEYLATIANQDRLVDAQEADIKKLEAERDRLRAKLELIAKGQWNAGVERDLTAAQFARKAIDGRDVI